MSTKEKIEGIWSEENGGFPWYLDEDVIKKQKDSLVATMDFAADRQMFSPDYPALALWEDHYLMVYGTLKRNKSNHRILDNRYCRFIADCFTTDPQWVLKQTRGGIPVALGAWGRKDAEVKAIKCELYLVKTKFLGRLDVFEQNGVMYKRMKVRASVPVPGQAVDDIVPAWMYVGLKSAWEDGNESLLVSPSFTRVRKDKREEGFYTYIGQQEVKKVNVSL